MNEAEFLETVRREASLDSEDAARDATDATLRTFGERITEGEANDVARHLPENPGRILVEASEGEGGVTAGEAETFSLEEFTERVSDRAGIDESDVVVARAVATALSDAAGEELATAREQLPSEFDVLFEPGGPVTEDEFLDAVREAGGLDSEEAARSATVATLRSLGERLSEGEAADLGLYLPDPFEEAILEAGDESATDDTFDEFVRRVSQREGVEKAEAADHARAVGSTLADAASEREVAAAKKQLPDPFGTLFDRPTGQADEDA